MSVAETGDKILNLNLLPSHHTPLSCLQGWHEYFISDIVLFKIKGLASFSKVFELENNFWTDKKRQ